MIQEFELDHKFEDRSHILVWVQFLWKENLPIYQWDIQKYEIGKFNMMIIKDWWFNFTMDSTGSNTDSEKGMKLGKNTSVNIESGSGIELPSWGSGSFMLKFNFRKRITCQNINVVLKIFMLVKFKWVCWNWILIFKTP